MVFIIAKNFVKKGCEAEFEKIAKQLEKDTNEKDEGCIRYALVKDKSNPNVYAFFEEWVSEELLDRHIRAKHSADASPLLAPLLEKPGEATFFSDVK